MPANPDRLLAALARTATVCWLGRSRCDQTRALLRRVSHLGSQIVRFPTLCFRKTVDPDIERRGLRSHASIALVRITIVAIATGKPKWPVRIALGSRGVADNGRLWRTK